MDLYGTIDYAQRYMKTAKDKSVLDVPLGVLIGLGLMIVGNRVEITLKEDKESENHEN